MAQVSRARPHRRHHVDLQPKALLHVLSLVPFVKPRQQGRNRVPARLHTLSRGAAPVPIVFISSPAFMFPNTENSPNLHWSCEMKVMRTLASIACTFFRPELFAKNVQLRLAKSLSLPSTDITFTKYYNDYCAQHDLIVGAAATAAEDHSDSKKDRWTKLLGDETYGDPIETQLIRDSLIYLSYLLIRPLPFVCNNVSNTQCPLVM